MKDRNEFGLDSYVRQCQHTTSYWIPPMNNILLLEEGVLAAVHRCPANSSILAERTKTQRRGLSFNLFRHI